MTCPACYVMLRCACTSCRNKWANDPTALFFVDFIYGESGLWIQACQNCGFKMTAEEWEELQYRRAITDGSWPEAERHLHRRPVYTRARAFAEPKSEE